MQSYAFLLTLALQASSGIKVWMEKNLKSAAKELSWLRVLAQDVRHLKSHNLYSNL